ncbi:MAG: c-type cytochrome biogenesis protein CcsB [Chitinivibrionales bacterium]
MDSMAQQSIELPFFWLAFMAYSIACVLYVVFFGLNKKNVAIAASVFMGAALVFHTAAIAGRSIHLHHLPLTNMFEYINVFSWFSSCFYFVYLIIYKHHILGAFIAFLVFMLMTAGSILPKTAEMQLVPALQSYWLQIHVTLACLSEAAFLAAFAANIMYILKRIFPSASKFSGRLPEIQTLDRIAYRAICVGYPLFTVGALFAGSIWAEQAWGSFWSWDPKEVGSLIVWLVYSAYLHARFVKGWSGMRAALLSAAGFICTILTFFANLILGGLHSYG